MMAEVLVEVGRVLQSSEIPHSRSGTARRQVVLSQRTLFRFGRRSLVRLAVYFTNSPWPY